MLRAAASTIFLDVPLYNALVPCLMTMVVSVGALCRFDKLFGMFSTKTGKVRRMDLIITPHEEFAFCLLGWTGSKQYLRFLRQHAGNSNMYLNSHRQDQAVSL